VDHFEEDGALYLVMEKIEGESLEQPSIDRDESAFNRGSGVLAAGS
jgi:hypothetical protein